MDIASQPYPFRLSRARAALLMIDMQRDFLEPGGFGESLGNDVTKLRDAIAPTQSLLRTARSYGMTIIHTREGHRPDLSDLPESKRLRGRFGLRIGDDGPMGRILIRGEPGHAIIPELTPLTGETIIDKPGKGAFYATRLDAILREQDIEQLIICGVTTEVCVFSTVREANDRGYDCLVMRDCTASYSRHFHDQALNMIQAQDGIFGWVGESGDLLAALPAMHSAA